MTRQIQRSSRGSLSIWQTIRFLSGRLWIPGPLIRSCHHTWPTGLDWPMTRHRSLGVESVLLSTHWQLGRSTRKPNSAKPSSWTRSLSRPIRASRCSAAGISLRRSLSPSIIGTDSLRSTDSHQGWGSKPGRTRLLPSQIDPLPRNGKCGNCPNTRMDDQPFGRSRFRTSRISAGVTRTSGHHDSSASSPAASEASIPSAMPLNKSVRRTISDANPPSEAAL